MARRGFPRAAALVATLFLGLAGVNAPARGQVEVRMWTLLSGGDGARMRALVDDFNATSATCAWSARPSSGASLSIRS